MSNLTNQQKEDYYYGYNLRLADELGEFDNYIKQPVTLEGKKELSIKLEQKLFDQAVEDTLMHTKARKQQLKNEILNPQL